MGTPLIANNCETFAVQVPVLLTGATAPGLQNTSYSLRIFYSKAHFDSVKNNVQTRREPVSSVPSSPSETSFRASSLQRTGLKVIILKAQIIM